MLYYVILFPIIGILIITLTPLNKKKYLKIVALNFSCFSFTSSLILWLFFSKDINTFQFVIKTFWLFTLNLNFIFGIDGISLTFILLTTLLIPLCLLNSWNSVHNYLKEFLIIFLLLEFFLISSFCILDVFLFYIFFESILAPMILIIGIWGSWNRKILAAYYFFFFTFLCSVTMLLSILYIYVSVGTTDYQILLTFCFSKKEQKILWFSFFIAFASKVPMIPLHLWLPEAHVEAPTAGSVILAGVLLKLGTYGLIRFSLPLFPKACFFFTPLVYTIAIAGVIYASFTAIWQTDFKWIIAYTSIAHMNLVIVGVFSFNLIGLEGAILQSLSHGFVASALFLIIGIVYERYKTWIILYFGGLIAIMPLYVIIFLFFTIANISFPGTSNFVGEFLILLGSFKMNKTITLCLTISVIIGGAYSLWLLNWIAFGNLKIQYLNKFLDLNIWEFLIFIPLTVNVLIIGVNPGILLNLLHNNVCNLIEILYF